MKYACPACPFGSLRPVKSTYVRRMGNVFVTRPDFSAWRCDCCGYTRYDAAALAQLELLLGPDPEGWDEACPTCARQVTGPANCGPHRWSS